MSRRAKITPERAGLPAYGANRRVQGLRREEVAMLAGISVEYYTRLERGNTSGVSEDVLEGIARALQLDEAERAHLFDLVRAANRNRPTVHGPTQERVRPTIQRILDSMVGVPAYVRNGRLDISGRQPPRRRPLLARARRAYRPAQHGPFYLLKPKSLGVLLHLGRHRQRRRRHSKGRGRARPVRPTSLRPGRRAVDPQ